MDDGLKKGGSSQPTRTKSGPVKKTNSITCFVKCRKPEQTPTDILISDIVNHSTWDDSIKIHALELATIAELMNEKPGFPSPNIPKYKNALTSFSRNIPGIVKAREEADVYRLSNPLLRLPEDMDNNLKSILSPILSSIDSTRIANFDHRIQRDSALINSMNMKADRSVISRQDSQPRLNTLIKQQHESISKKMKIIPDIQQSAQDIVLLKKYTTMTTDQTLIKKLEDSIVPFEEQTIERKAVAKMMIEKPKMITIDAILTAISPRLLDIAEQVEQPAAVTLPTNQITTPDILQPSPAQASENQSSPAKEPSEKPIEPQKLPEPTNAPQETPKNQAIEKSKKDKTPPEEENIIEPTPKKPKTLELKQTTEQPSAMPEQSQSNEDKVTATEKFSLISWLLSKASGGFWWFISFFIAV